MGNVFIVIITMTPPNDVDYKGQNQAVGGGDHSTAEYNGYAFNNAGK